MRSMGKQFVTLKKTIGLLLVLCMLFGVLPSIPASAESAAYEVSFELNGSAVSPNTTVDMKNGDKLKITLDFLVAVAADETVEIILPAMFVGLNLSAFMGDILDYVDLTLENVLDGEKIVGQKLTITFTRNVETAAFSFFATAALSTDSSTETQTITVDNRGYLTIKPVAPPSSTNTTPGVLSAAASKYMVFSKKTSAELSDNVITEKNFMANANISDAFSYNIRLIQHPAEL